MVNATHQRLKRARIERDLDTKIQNRPGPLELIENNILKTEDVVDQAVKGTYLDNPFPGFFFFLVGFSRHKFIVQAIVTWQITYSYEHGIAQNSYWATLSIQQESINFD